MDYERTFISIFQKLCCWKGSRCENLTFCYWYWSVLLWLLSTWWKDATSNSMDGLGVTFYGKKKQHHYTFYSLSGNKYPFDENIALAVCLHTYVSDLMTMRLLFCFQGKYSTKSDIWSFGVTLWEIFSYSRHSPYPTMSNQEVIHNLRRLSVLEESDLFEPLSKPHNCPRDVYQLMCDTWRRNDDDRPTFWEIHSFLTRKNLQFTPHLSLGVGSRATATAAASITGPSGSSSLVEHYIV